jgi:hypothetical protein
VAANNVARLPAGGSWQALTSGGVNGVNGPVTALATDGSGAVYAGGAFSTAGAANCANIARWAQSSWGSLGGGTDGAVAALAIGSHGSDVYAGGYFTHVNGLSASGVAKWASSTWSALGAGDMEGVEDWQQNDEREWVRVPAHVTALAVADSKLYVGGDFTLAGGQPAERVAVWDGVSWAPVGSGMNGVVEALAVTSDFIYAGGGFTVAGDTPASAMARWKR